MNEVVVEMRTGKDRTFSLDGQYAIDELVHDIKHERFIQLDFGAETILVNTSDIVSAHVLPVLSILPVLELVQDAQI